MSLSPSRSRGRFGNSSSAQLNLRVTGGVDDQSNQEDARKKRSQQPEPLRAQAAPQTARTEPYKWTSSCTRTAALPLP
ncbi:MAG: hypothetical protein ACLVD8_26060 [Enterocloster sp.]|uniref:hypothetical protein n=1 Tax=Enterocloster sp. TaxID=2719315 RepID=UPI00399C4501